MPPFFRPYFLITVFPFLLAGCQTLEERIADCREGDWTRMGLRDAALGGEANYAERQAFCAEHAGIAADEAVAPARYAAGWAEGNRALWTDIGAMDGEKALPSQYEAILARPDFREQHAAPNRAAYDQGWRRGQAQYWRGIGLRDGAAGLPPAGVLPPSGSGGAYGEGWQAGNRAFWEDAGRADIRDGKPEGALASRAARARAAGVTVREDAYTAAWHAGVTAYWRELGSQDAVGGKAFGERYGAAKKAGLTIDEAAYRQAWEARLRDYWHQAGREDGYGQPFQLARRMAGGGVAAPLAARTAYAAAWNEQNALYCVADTAFERGRVGAGLRFDVCRPPVRAALRQAYRDGQDYEVAAMRYGQADEQVRDLENRLLETISSLARLDGDLRAGPGVEDQASAGDAARQGQPGGQASGDLRAAAARLRQELDQVRLWQAHHRDMMRRLRRES